MFDPADKQRDALKAGTGAGVREVCKQDACGPASVYGTEAVDECTRESSVGNRGAKYHVRRPGRQGRQRSEHGVASGAWWVISSSIVMKRQQPSWGTETPTFPGMKKVER